MLHTTSGRKALPPSAALILGTAGRNTSTPGTVAWLPWTVQARAHGFHVSRESAGGTKTEFLRNAVGKVTIFRSRERADEACSKANDGGAA